LRFARQIFPGEALQGNIQGQFPQENSPKQQSGNAEQDSPGAPERPLYTRAELSANKRSPTARSLESGRVVNPINPAATPFKSAGAEAPALSPAAVIKPEKTKKLSRMEKSIHITEAKLDKTGRKADNAYSRLRFDGEKSPPKLRFADIAERRRDDDGNVGLEAERGVEKAVGRENLYDAYIDSGGGHQFLGNSLGFDWRPLISSRFGHRPNPTDRPGGDVHTGLDIATVIENSVKSPEEREFFTITAPAGNEYYIVIDREKGTKNVYLLSAATEDDLLGMAKSASAFAGG
jgi:hypothetical protein